MDVREVSFPLSSAHAFRRIAHNSRSQSVDMCFEQHTILGERKHKLCHLPKKDIHNCIFFYHLSEDKKSTLSVVKKNLGAYPVMSCILNSDSEYDSFDV